MAVTRKTGTKSTSRTIKKAAGRPAQKKPIAIRDILGPERVNSLFKAAQQIDASQLRV